MAETEKKPTQYEIFLRMEDGRWSHVTTIEAGNAERALRALTDKADETNTDASGEYMIAPKSYVTYLRPKRKVTTAYDMEPFALSDPPQSLAGADDPAPDEDVAA